MNRVAADGFPKTKSFASVISLETEKDFFVGILNQHARTPKSTISVCCFGCGSASDAPPHTTCLIDLNVCILLRHPPLPAIQRDMLKLKPQPFQQTDFYFAPSPPRPSVFISPTPSHLPPQPLCLPFRRRSRWRAFALITDLLYTPVNRDRDALLTPPLAHCHIPSIPALLSKPVHQDAHEHTCDWGLFLIVWQRLRECSPLTNARTSKGRTSLQSDTLNSSRNGRHARLRMVEGERYENDADFVKNFVLEKRAQSQRMCN